MKTRAKDQRRVSAIGGDVGKVRSCPRQEAT